MSFSEHRYDHKNDNGHLLAFVGADDEFSSEHFASTSSKCISNRIR